MRIVLVTLASTHAVEDEWKDSVREGSSPWSHGHVVSGSFFLFQSRQVGELEILLSSGAIL